MEEPTNLGLSVRVHSYLDRLHKEEHFAEMRDAYKFGIALALSKGLIPPEIGSPKSNIFGVASIDPDRTIFYAISALMDTGDLPVYRWAERLAEWGVEELYNASQKGMINFAKLVEEAKEFATK